MLAILNYMFALFLSLLVIVCNNLITHFYDIWIFFLLFVAFLLAGYALTFIVLFLLALPIKRKTEFTEKPSKFYRFLFDLGLSFLMYLARVKVTIEGKEKLPKNKKIVVLANHISKFDSMSINHVLKEYEISWIGKKSLFNMPFVGNYIYRIGYLALDRDSLKQGARVINQAIKYLDNDDCSMGICPEGTRNTTDEILLPLKPGSLKLALKVKNPVAIMTCTNTEKVAKRWPFKRTHVYIKVQQVFEHAEIENYTTVEFAKIVEDLMKESLLENKNRKA